MKRHTVAFLPDHIRVAVEEGTTLLQAQITAGLHPDAPCGGKGTCGKCRVFLDGREMLACRTAVDRDLAVTLPETRETAVLTQGAGASVLPDGENAYALAFDVGTTTIVGYLLDGKSGALLANVSQINPQTQYGADVISRIQHVHENGSDAMQACICDALAHLTNEAAEKAGIRPEEISTAAVVGNTAMHHLLLGVDPKPLVTPPYMPGLSHALELPADGILPIGGSVRILPNIAGFVGADTVGCILASRFDELDELTLLLDIGTNGEMVLGDKRRRIACSTAAGPAFEGAKISYGMRGAEGAVDHTAVEQGKLTYHVIGGGEPLGLCGSGLLDLTASLLEMGVIDGSGYLENGPYRLGGTAVSLTQKDIREVQLAKAAIRAGITLLAKEISAAVEDIRQVYLAGAFGNYLDPVSACRIGMIPDCLLERIRPIGNAAGTGARMCAVSRGAFLHSRTLAEETEFLELASLPEFQDCFVDSLDFSEDTE